MTSQAWFIATLGAAISLMACGGHTVIDTRSDGAGAGTANPSECASAEPILQQNTDIETGFVRCSDGFVHRTAPSVCESPSTPGDCNIGGGDCEVDADCTQKSYGACVARHPWEAWKGCQCTYRCATDADCSAGSVCACAGVVGGASRCVSADCEAAADCGAGLCGLSVSLGSCGEVRARLACHGSDAACRVDADCADEPLVSCFNEEDQPAACKLGSEGWICTSPDECGPCG
jgi:hypothetical protein